MESNHRLRLKSLIVPSVIELVKTPLSSIPERYICHDLEPPFLPDKTQIEQLPIISMASLLDGDPTEFDKFHLACSHGVSDELLERFKVECKEFFELPMEEKKKFWQTPDEIEGFGQKFVVSEDQKLDWADMFTATALPLKQRRPHLLPLLPLPFRESMERYTSEVKQLATKLLDCIAKDLMIEKEEFRGLFDDGRHTIKLGYYPPCPQYDKVMGTRVHADGGALTILLQLNQVDGLQILKDRRWVRVSPLPNAFVVNIGNILEIMSNGIYSSVLHRAMVNPETERLSAASFFHARLDAEVGPAHNLVTSESPAMFRRITTAEYLAGFYAQPLKEKSYLDTLRI